MKIQIDIERLILYEIDMPAERPVLLQAVREELTQLLRTRTLKQAYLSKTSISSLEASTVRRLEDRHPAPLGRQIAGSIYGVLAAEGEKTR